MRLRVSLVVVLITSLALPAAASAGTLGVPTIKQARHAIADQRPYLEVGSCHHSHSAVLCDGQIEVTCGDGVVTVPYRINVHAAGRYLVVEELSERSITLSCPLPKGATAKQEVA
jgi:hypothetical protein